MKQESCELEADVSYTERPCLKMQNAKYQTNNYIKQQCDIGTAMCNSWCDNKMILLLYIFILQYFIVNQSLILLLTKIKLFRALCSVTVNKVKTILLLEVLNYVK